MYTERWPDAQSGESLHSPAGAPSLRSRCLHHLQCENLGSIYLLEQSKTGVGVNGKRVRAASPYFPQRAQASISTRGIGSPSVSRKLSFRACGPRNLMKAVQRNGPFPALSPLFSGQLLIATMRLSSLLHRTWFTRGKEMADKIPRVNIYLVGNSRCLKNAVCRFTDAISAL